MKARIFDDRACWLGEGLHWHPKRQELFWCDVHNKRLLRSGGDQWDFPVIISALAWVDEDRLLIGSERALHLFDITTGAHEEICALEADNPVTRSNDGRADAHGGFWIGTMGKDHEKAAGSFYRYYRGEVRTIFTGIDVPNALCFAPDGSHGFFTDTHDGRILKMPLDKDGWPTGDPTVFCNPAADGWLPDGAVLDADGNLWNAQYGGSRVAAYGPDGAFLRAVEMGASQTTCPAFGGKDMTTLFCTSATQTMTDAALAAEPGAGKTFFAESVARGIPEFQVIL
ncbi:MAG: SMP-30/gluconolactonase/LRE family protein [Pseudomonadota bacterium]